MAAASAYALSLSLISSSNSKKPITSSSSSSLSSLFPQAPKSLFLSPPITKPISLSSKQTPRRRPWTIVRSTLPTANPDRVTAGKISKWSAGAIKSFGMGELEARKLKYPTTGTEALLMGILVGGTSEAAKFLRANGITLFKVREKTVEMLGKSDMYFFSPEHPPLTEPAQRALDWTVDEKLKSGDDGEVTCTHMLLGIWSEKDSAGHKILASLGFDDEKASELAKNADKDIVMNYK